eukprot:11366-Heterococcus_DN1.PRE.1
MARSSVVPNADYVEFEVNRGLEWLSAEQWHRRLAACLVLRELALNAPTTFYDHAAARGQQRGSEADSYRGSQYAVV